MLKEYTRETFLQQFRRRDFDDYPEELAAVRRSWLLSVKQVTRQCLPTRNVLTKPALLL